MTEASPGGTSAGTSRSDLLSLLQWYWTARRLGGPPPYHTCSFSEDGGSTLRARSPAARSPAPERLSPVRNAEDTKPLLLRPTGFPPFTTGILPDVTASIHWAAAPPDTVSPQPSAGHQGNSRCRYSRCWLAAAHVGLSHSDLGCWGFTYSQASPSRKRRKGLAQNQPPPSVACGAGSAMSLLCDRAESFSPYPPICHQGNKGTGLSERPPPFCFLSLGRSHFSGKMSMLACHLEAKVTVFTKHYLI